MTTEAKIGYGTLFAIRTSTGPDVYTEIAEIANVTPPGISRDSVDASHEQSPGAHREFIPGLVDAGEVKFDLNFVPVSASDELLRAGFDDRSLQTCRITFPDDETVSFSAFITNYEPDAPIDDKMSASVAFKVSGKPTWAAAAAPVNSILPSISGLANVGQTLTAYPGVWTQAASFTYQWNNNGVAISGATDSSYVPGTGDVGERISVTVTATNSVGSASATSEETPAVDA